VALAAVGALSSRWAWAHRVILDQEISGEGYSE